MKNFPLYLLIVFCFSMSYAQVGIGTTDPQAELDIHTRGGLPALGLQP